jgi:hypothetical protein
MISLVSLYPAVFLGNLPLKMEFFEHVPIQSRSIYEYQKYAYLYHWVSSKICEVLGLWCLSWEFLFTTARIRPPYQILPNVITLAFDSKLDIKLLETFALVCKLESWIFTVLSWAHEILSSRVLRLPRVRLSFKLGFSSYMFCLWGQAYECVLNGSSNLLDGGTDTQLPEWFWCVE